MTDKEWTTVIKPKTGLLDLRLKEIWQYKDLIFMFLKRNFNSAYKQTVLGPLWFLVTPLFLRSNTPQPRRPRHLAPYSRKEWLGV